MLKNRKKLQFRHQKVKKEYNHVLLKIDLIKTTLAWGQSVEIIIDKSNKRFQKIIHKNRN